MKPIHHHALLSLATALSLLTGCGAATDSDETLGSERQELAACAEQPFTIAAASASSEQNGGYFAASKAIDFQSNTRWSSEPGLSAPQWLRLDLGQRRFVSSLSINWQTAFSPLYDIQASDDGVSWATLRSVTNTQAGVQTVAGLDATARYIRIYARTLSSYGNVSIVEVTVSGDISPSCNTTPSTCGQTTRLAPTLAQATSTEFSYTPAAAAVDGVYSTRWSSAYSDDQALALDLGAVARIDQVRVTWQTAYAAKYAIETAPSLSGPWTVAVQNNAGHGGVETLNVGGVSARYVRLHGIQRATGYGYSVWELDVLGSKDSGCAPNLLTTGWDPNTTANNIGAPSGVSVPGLYTIDQTVQNRIDFTQSGQYCPVGGGGWVSFTQHVTVPTSGNSYHLALDIPRNEGVSLVIASAKLGGVAGTNYLPRQDTDTSGNTAGVLSGTGKIEADFATSLSAGQSVDLTVRFSIIGVNIPNTNCGARIQSYTLQAATLTRSN